MKVGCLITVRLGSTRLPRKAVRKVNGREIISYLIRRTKYFCDDVMDIYICTTKEPENDELDLLANKLGITVFHGDTHNILKRHLECAEKHHLDFVINIDGDDILCNPRYLRIIAEGAENRDFDVIKTEGLPFGTNSMGYYTDVIKKTLAHVSQNVLETGWGRVVTDTRFNSVKVLKALEDERLDEARMTLDYLEDFQFFEKIIEECMAYRMDIPQEEIIQYLKYHPEIIAINSGLNDEYWRNLNVEYEKEKTSI